VSDKPKTVLHEVLVQLNDENVCEKARLLSKLLSEVEELKMEKKASAASYKSMIESKASEISKVARIIVARREKQMVECTIGFDYETATVAITDPHTGEVVETRPMTADERQQKMFDDEHESQEDQSNKLEKVGV